VIFTSKNFSKLLLRSVAMKKLAIVILMVFFFISFTFSYASGNLLVTAPSSFQSELGCADDWQPNCLLTRLTDMDGDDIYTWSSVDIPAGDWQVKIAMNLTMSTNYGANGELDGANIPFTVERTGQRVIFSWDSQTHILYIDINDNQIGNQYIVLNEANQPDLPAFYANPDARRPISPSRLNFDIFEPVLDLSGQLITQIKLPQDFFVQVTLRNENNSETFLEGFVPVDAFWEFARANGYELTIQATPVATATQSDSEQTSVEAVEVQGFVPIMTQNARQLEQLSQLTRGAISEIELSPVDDMLAVVSTTGIYLFNSANLEEEPVHLSGLDDAINHIAFSPDGTSIAYTSCIEVDWYTCVYGTYSLTSQEIRILSRINWAIASDITFSLDSLYVIALIYDHSSDQGKSQTLIWDSNSGRLVNRFDVPTSDMILPRNDGNLILGNSSAAIVTIIDFDTATSLLEFQAQVNGIASFDYNPHNDLLLTSGANLVDDTEQDFSIRVWNAATGDLSFSLDGFGGDASFSSTGDYMVYTNTFDRRTGYLNIFDVQTQSNLASLALEHSISDVRFTADDRTLVANNTTSLITWDIASSNLSFGEIVSPFTSNIASLVFTNDGQSLIGALDDGIYSWDTQTWERDRIIDESASSYNGQGNRIAISPDNQFLARTVQTDEPIQIYDLNSGDTILSIAYGYGPIFSLAYHPSGDYIAAGRAGFDVAFYSIQSGTLLSRFQEGGVAFALAFNPDGTLLASGNADGNVRVLNTITREYEYVSENDNPVTSLAFSHNGSLLVTRSDELKVLNAEDGELVQIIDMSDVIDMAFSPDDTILATISAQQLSLWETNTWRMLWSEDVGGVSVEFNPQGTLIVTSDTSIVRLWVVNTGADSDRDSLDDIHDDCPSVAGELNGCPDTDNDSFVDTIDECPQEAGTAMGCPDADGDNVSDQIDECPQELGSIQANGCPDGDSDSIVDSQDLCPSEAGVAAFSGCADTDLDNVQDAEDNCPVYAGTIENQGCPATGSVTTNANLRSEPSQSGTVLKTLTPSDEFYVVGTDEYGQWVQAIVPSSTGDITGWIFGDLVITSPDADDDNDGVSNQADLCPRRAGDTTSGCPKPFDEEELAEIAQRLNVQEGTYTSDEFLDMLPELLVEGLNGVLERINEGGNWGVLVGRYERIEGQSYPILNVNGVQVRLSVNDNDNGASTFDATDFYYFHGVPSADPASIIENLGYVAGDDRPLIVIVALDSSITAPQNDSLLSSPNMRNGEPISAQDVFNCVTQNNCQGVVTGNETITLYDGPTLVPLIFGALPEN
jgi:WD40 repeat protein